MRRHQKRSQREIIMYISRWVVFILILLVLLIVISYFFNIYNEASQENGAADTVKQEQIIKDTLNKENE